MIFEVARRRPVWFSALPRAAFWHAQVFLKRGRLQTEMSVRRMKGLGRDEMYQADIEWKVAPNRYSARKMAKPVNFACFAPKAHGVTIAGDFNHWDEASHPLARQPDGAWTIQLQLNHGHHQYVFLVDGHPALDPKANGAARHARFGKVSLLSVS